MKQYGFPKSEHLTVQKEIADVFENGASVVIYPVRALWCKSNEKASVKVLIAAPKKLFNKAVERNYCKRLLREAYRLNKQMLIKQISDKNHGINIAFSIFDSKKQNFNEIFESVLQILNKIIVVLQ
ncbi:MAG: ribonuclease P protein component [Prevotellaceae bacterium]|jgi:ribonuclease P protein component|nr:ribonuclease P protein component [Prevotellaceae bacterium]